MIMMMMMNMMMSTAMIVQMLAVCLLRISLTERPTLQDYCIPIKLISNRPQMLHTAVTSLIQGVPGILLSGGGSRKQS